MKRLLFALMLCVVALPAGAVEVKRVVSPLGIEAWLVEDHTNPLLSLSLAFRGGSIADPAGKEGTAELLSGLLDEGAGDLQSQEFQRRLEDRAIKLRFDAGRDAFTGSLKTLSKHRDEAFGLLRLALTQPRFDEEPVARVRSQVLANLARDLSDPDTLAGRAWMTQSFPDHPYGRPVEGTPESVRAVTVDDLRSFVRGRFARGNLIVGVSGDVTPEQLASLLDTAFGALPAKPQPLAVAETAPKAGGTVFVEHAEVPQSVLVFGQAGLDRRDPDWYAGLVMNYILGGGGFSSRLTEEVRERRGLAYGIGTSLNPMDYADLLIGGSATQNARVAETIAVLRKVWQEMRQTGPADKALADAKTYLIGSFPLQMTSTGAIAGILVAMQRDQLGIEYLDQRAGLIAKVTAADVRRVADRLLDVDKLTVVVVGNPQGLQGAVPLAKRSAGR